jgi:hypothetical protein
MTVKTSRPSLTATAAVVLVAMFGITACNSDPSAKRVAQDLVRTLTQDDPEARECMLEVINGYSEDDLEDIGNDAREGDQAEQAAANEALAQFQADLEACR